MELRAQASQAERAIAGDGEALRALWESNRRWVAAVALAHMPRDGTVDLEDVLQEVGLRLVRTVHRVRDPSVMRAWLRTVTVNVARTAGRRKNARLKLVRGAADERRGEDHVSSPRGVDGEVGRVEEGRRLLAAAERLPAEYREPLLLRCVRGMSYRQIADVMGVPVTTIETRLARARRMLREEMGEEKGSVEIAPGRAEGAER
ncbi:MAG: RNA polymerase sigma factor [Phycisphaerales bacterium]